MKPTCNPYFPSLRMLQFLERKFAAMESEGKTVPLEDLKFLELWKSVLKGESLEFPDSFEQVKELAH